MDINDTAGFIKMVGDEELMARITMEAGIEAATVGSFDAATGGLATKTFGATMKSIFGREAVNLVAQTGIQMAGGALGEWMAEGLSKGDWEFNREEVAEALGELVTGPMDVAGAAVSGVKTARKEKADAKVKAALDKLGAVVDEARKTAELEGLDPLQQEIAGEQAAAEYLESVLATARKEEALAGVFTDEQVFRISFERRFCAYLDVFDVRRLRTANDSLPGRPVFFIPLFHLDHRRPDIA